MSESTGVSSRIDEADTEVELSAQDLLALSDTPPVAARETGPAVQPSRPATSALPRKPAALKASPKRYASAVRVCLSLVALVGALSVAYVLTTSHHARLAAGGVERADQTNALAAKTMDKDQPVRYANPFDKNEVFEFPAGTTETEAREAVAALLMERAISREKT